MPKGEGGQAAADGVFFLKANQPSFESSRLTQRHGGMDRWRRYPLSKLKYSLILYG
jgi:hypothetical protein